MVSKIHSTLKFITHPIFIFVASQIVWISLTILWIRWFANAMETIEFLKKSSYLSLESSTTPMALIIGCILLGMLLVGSIWIFVVSQKQAQFLRKQQAFVSSVTHELRSPLASLKLMIETAEARRVPTEVQTQMLSMAKKDIERLLRLVNQVLISSRLDRGVEDFSKSEEELHLKSMLIQSIERAAWLDSNIQDRVRIDCPDDLTLKASKMALLLIFGNIIENAVKYSPPLTPIQVRVDVSPNACTVSFKDFGFGLNSNEMKKIFRIFHRGKVATAKALPGTGVGLFLVKNIVRILGGKISVYSQGDNQGSTFTVELPIKNLSVV